MRYFHNTALDDIKEITKKFECKSIEFTKFNSYDISVTVSIYVRNHKQIILLNFAKEEKSLLNQISIDYEKLFSFNLSIDGFEISGSGKPVCFSNKFIELELKSYNPIKIKHEKLQDIEDKLFSNAKRRATINCDLPERIYKEELKEQTHMNQRELGWHALDLYKIEDMNLELSYEYLLRRYKNELYHQICFINK